jgi:propionate CoA-transferase
MFVTERCVLELTKDGMVLLEIAPGMDLQKDILAHMEFKPIIPKDLKTMDADIFKEKMTPGKLRDHIIKG